LVSSRTTWWRLRRKCSAGSSLVTEKKSETRNPKFETNSNDQKAQNSNELVFGFRVLDSGFECFVCFEFRDSDFGFYFCKPRKGSSTVTPQTIEGRSSPLGATLSLEGANFSVYSKHATGIELLLFDGVDDGRKLGKESASQSATYAVDISTSADKQSRLFVWSSPSQILKSRFRKTRIFFSLSSSLVRRLLPC
jgi:hypothetical protein